jgi:hypothetical protein
VDAETIALAGVVATAVVGLGGLALNFWNADRDRKAREQATEAERQHVERLARAERYHRLRERAYAEGADLLERQRLRLLRTEGAWSKLVGPVEPIPDAEFAALAGRLAITAPENVHNAITQAQVRSNIVLLLVEQLRRAGDIEIGERSAEDQARVEQERHAELEAARDSATGALDAALTLMRDDLARL